jgi:hypothetical protein
LRGQIETTLKRLKGLLDLGHVPVKDPQLAQSHGLAKLLAALLLENLTRDFWPFPPEKLSDRPGGEGSGTFRRHPR